MTLPGLGRVSFSARIVIALVVILLLMQAATLLIVDVAVDRNVRDQLAERVEVGGRVWSQLQSDRGNELKLSVSALAADFAFREAVATGDASTVLSALLNHGERIEADIVLLLAEDGSLVASTGEGDGAGYDRALAPLVAGAVRDGRSVGVAALDGVPYTLAIVPVLAPTRIGWVAMGKRFGAREVGEFRALTGLDAAVVATHASTRKLVATTLRDGEAGALVAAPRLPVAPQSILLAGHDFHAGATTRESGRAGGIDVVLLADVDRAMQPYRKLKQQILVLATLAALLALAVSIVVGRSVTRPVARLAAAARRIESGDYAEPLPVAGTDELSELATAFNRMQAGIADREQRIRHQAHHDSLTGLPNRMHALAVLQAVLDAPGHGQRQCAVLMIDLDRFKEINDTLGHAFGDGVLEQVARRLRQAIRTRDLLARLGGDEFLVLLESTDEDKARERAWAIVQALEQPLDVAVGQAQVSISASVGLALHPVHADTADVLLRRADIAMYEAKQAHQRVAVYQAGHDESHLRQVRLIGDLRRARERDEFQVVYQPKVDVRTRRPTQAEVLLRWKHAELGYVSPDEFIPLAEHCGLIHEITGFVLGLALQQVAAWRADGLEIGIAVNLSPTDLLDARLPETVGALLDRHGLPADCLILEITEGTVMREIHAALATMHALRALGVRLSIDDFGTGQSSLAQLRSLPVDEIKIDKSFVMQLESHPDDTVIVRSAIEIGHNMGLVVIAEGVEHAASFEILRELRCDMVQGYLYSRPLAADEFRRWHAGFEADHATTPPREATA